MKQEIFKNIIQDVITEILDSACKDITSTCVPICKYNITLREAQELCRVLNFSGVTAELMVSSPVLPVQDENLICYPYLEICWDKEHFKSRKWD